jgi:hypothetical protein
LSWVDLWWWWVEVVRSAVVGATDARDAQPDGHTRDGQEAGFR